MVVFCLSLKTGGGTLFTRLKWLTNLQFLQQLNNNQAPCLVSAFFSCCEFSLNLCYFDRMATVEAYDKLIFGLRVKRLRKGKGLSFQELSKASGLSISYLNEIEKGKKYPKPEKLQALAAALDSSAGDLTSSEMEESLAPVMALLQSNFLNELPLDFFGIELTKVVEIIASAPKRVGAFIRTLVELSRNYAMREEHFYFGALRSYLEMQNNYFPDLEAKVKQFRKEMKLDKLPVTGRAEQLAGLLEDQYGYDIIEGGLNAYPELIGLRSLFVPTSKKLLLNKGLTDMQRAFQFGKELGFQYLNLEKRAMTSSLLRVRTFDEVLSHFQAGYFSAALLMDEGRFIKDIRNWLGGAKWDPNRLLALADDYGASPEMLFQRMTNVLPAHLGIRRLFFLRTIYTPEKESFRLDKELHLGIPHPPRSNELSEHYCRRWLSLSILKQLKNPDAPLVSIQRSHYYNTESTYLCITLAKPGYPRADQHVSVTLGILEEPGIEKVIGFIKDPAIQETLVNQTCERCPIKDCEERAAPPKVVNARDRRRSMEAAIARLTDELG
jgi:transcriptional regulator with XRE-family HTH domain